MVSNFQFLAKALRFPGTAPTLLVLSLTAFVASQLNDRLPSQAFSDPSDDQDSDNSPDAPSLSLQPIAPLATPLSPEQLPLEPSPLEGLPKLNLSPDELLKGIQPSNLSEVLPNLEVSLPQPPAPLKNKQRTVSPVTPVRVAPRVVESVVSQSLAYQTVNVSSNLSSNASAAHQGLGESTAWVDLQQHWSKPYVEALAALGLIKGLPNGHFDPDRPMTRAELADLLQRSLPRPQNRPGIPTLTDVPSQHWAAASIDRAVGMGFFPDAESTGSFNPDRPASRLVTWGAIVSGLDLASSKQHNALLQAWEASRSHPPAGTTNARSLEAELTEPVTRGEVAALLYHALRFTDAGKQLAYIAADTGLDHAPDDSPLVETSTPATETAVADPTSSTSSTSNSPSDTPVPDFPGGTLSPHQPLLVAAQLPLPDPLLSPLPPLSEESPDAVGSDDFSADFSSPAPSAIVPSTDSATVYTAERLSPEFSGELLPLAASESTQGSLEQNGLETAAPNAAGLDETYTLGAGDRVFIEVFGLPQYSQEYQVLVDGSLNLPRAGRMVVEGMTLAQAESLIYGRYARYYQQPATSVVLVTPRSLRISVTGEVNRPGVYRLSPTEGTAVLSLTQALQEAGGIRQDADLRQIKVYRSQRNGEPQELALNLWNLLQTGDLTQDISLRDGDRVIIPKAEALDVATVNQIATANIAPSTIEVTVVGSDTENQGSLKVSPNTPLSQVVLATGGFNDRRGSRTVNLIRLHPNGTVEQRIVDVPIAANINEDNNPILRDKDVIVLDRSKGQVMRQGALGMLGNILRVIPFVNFFF